MQDAKQSPGTTFQINIALFVHMRAILSMMENIILTFQLLGRTASRYTDDVWKGWCPDQEDLPLVLLAGIMLRVERFSHLIGRTTSTEASSGSYSATTVPLKLLLPTAITGLRDSRACCLGSEKVLGLYVYRHMSQ
jgi:hypothetical protein